MTAPHQPSQPVEVVAGVITDPRGRVLLTRRTEGRDLAGLWEFPGGKREPGESPEAALVRELQEELGIQVQVGPALIKVPQRYPHKRLCLDVRRVTAWIGIPRGQEGQALAWVPLSKLARYDMPPADRPVVAALQHPRHYLVTPPPDDDAAWLEALTRAVDKRATRVQLRDGSGCDPARWRSLVGQAVEACRSAGVEVLINGDIALARSLSAGVHLRAAQLPVLDARPLPGDQPVAASCHDVEDLHHAQRLGCDFVVLGPLKPTPTHPGAAGLGWQGFAALREHSPLPIYAIGGMTPDDLDQARAHGAQGIAAIRSLWSSAASV